MRLRSLKLAGLVAFAGLAAFAAASEAETAQQGGLRVKFDGQLTPHELPRQGTRPVTVRIGGRITTADGSEPPQLRRIEIAINREGRIDRQGLPACRLEQIQPSTTQKALAACRGAKVGEGRFSANVAIPGQAPFPSRGKVIAFNGVEGGRPVIFAHVYGTDPVPTSYTLPLFIGHAKGTFATTLSASLPQVTGQAGFVTGIQLTLGRSFRAGGRSRSYLLAGCPAPAGFSSAVFPLARTSFGFDGGKTLSSTLIRSCRARG
ncbi:MAG TPA: hypothetical protein VKB23_05075 [Solirubrobacterales bacterium]|nr:hypothetical protein [Solirubrobacterales bacterium]